jgi:hypothetical protein
MPTLRIKARFRRRRRTSEDPTWKAIVEQLLATPSNREPFEARPDTEYKWARRLGMHINRPRRRRRPNRR